MPTDLLQHESTTVAAVDAAPARARTSSTASSSTVRPQPQRAAQPAVARELRPPGRHRLRVDPPGRPGHRALRRARASRPTRRTSTPRTSCELAVEGGCNAFASTFGVLGVDQPQVGAQDPVHREAQPQRAADVPQRVRPDHVRQRSSARGTWARRASARRSTSAREHSAPPDRRGRRARSRRPTSSGCSPCCGATCATRRSSEDGIDYHLSADLTRPGQPPRRDDPGRHHQAEAAREQRRLQRAQPERRVVRQDEQAGLLGADDRQPDRPHPLPARSTATLGRIAAHQLAAARRRATATSPRPCARPSSTSAPAAPA